MVRLPERRARAAVSLSFQQVFQAVVEGRCAAEQLGSQTIEMLLLEQDILTDSAVKRLDGLERQVEPSALPLVGKLQVAVGVWTRRFARSRSRLADLSSELARVWTTSTAARPIVAATSDATAAVTAVRFLRIHLRDRSRSGSRRAGPARRPASGRGQGPRRGPKDNDRPRELPSLSG